ncbi:nicotinamide mononucleotide transporter [Lactobacillus sp. Sy-1]|uniref:nicotinamide mononucleotide transporter n=1 Tax=Lactobacillus sp. Sy-1 TaxID=2109645 RepID=UPI001C5A930D|nr:nicotinamide mononucleotide transporter [Lactobacillus sp. Sy-1]MBW1606060.1 nicotinamide mononucleotide transporter [Lactobacillus sp. Sy-1]
MFKMLRAIARSRAFDLVGVLIVVASAFLSGYLFETLDEVTHWGGISALVPFGLISAGSSVLSLYSDRLTARMNNLGNWIGLAGVILSGTIDYLLGNKGAIFTYPVTFVIQAWAIKVWMSSDRYKARKPPRGIKGLLIIFCLVIAEFLFSYYTNAIAFTQHDWLFYTTVLVFALSLIANAFNALKLRVQWQFWSLYNVVQLMKALIQGNFANVGKYIYYIVNSISGLAFWKE